MDRWAIYAVFFLQVVVVVIDERRLGAGGPWWSAKSTGASGCQDPKEEPPARRRGYPASVGGHDSHTIGLAVACLSLAVWLWLVQRSVTRGVVS